MKTLFLYIYFFFYMIISLFHKARINLLRKFGRSAEAEEKVFKFTSTCAKRIVLLSGVKVTLIGEENIPEEACLFVGNHQGMFDILVLIGYMKRVIGFIAKKEAKKIPVVRGWMENIHCVFIDRDNTREGLKSINEGVDNLKKGYSMVIFPEGTRSRGNKIGEFKKGSMRLGIKSGAPIVPMTIEGTYKIFEANKGKVTPAEVTITFSKPIYAKDFSKEEQANLSNIVRDIIASKGHME